jgi:hypothetical protein
VQNLAAKRLFNFYNLRRSLGELFMRLIAWISTAVLAAGFGVTAQAQLIGSVTASPATVKVGEPVTVTANVDVVSGNYCGFSVFYGDGKNADGYSDPGHPTPMVTTHTYAKAGTYTISMGGRNVESHPNCGGGDKFATVTVTEGAKAAVPAAAVAVAAAAKPAAAAAVCAAPWKLSGKVNAKTGAYTCVAKAKTAVPEPKPACPGDLTYFENAKKGQFGCKP